MQCVSCSFEEFRDLVAMNVPSFSQKRALLKRMKVMTAALEQLEQMLVEQKSLTEQEQEMYDAMVDVSDKVEYLNKELEKMVAKGRLTKGEQKQMMDDFAKKMEELDVMSAAAEAEGKAKRRDALLAKKDEIADKANAVAECKPIVYTVAHEKEMNDLRAEIAALSKLENSGKLLKGDDLSKLAKKPRLEERLAQLEGEDKGWFEDECRDVLFTPSAVKKAPAKKKAAASGAGGGGWLVTAAKKSGSARPAGGAKAAGPANPFALLGDD
jgi:myosin heavy subunit